jgi:hypothetical protein
MKPAGLRLLAFLFSGRHSLAACCDAILQIIHHMLLAERARVLGAFGQWRSGSSAATQIK